LCAPALAGLPPGTYTVEFGLVSTLAEGAQPEPEIFTFPEGWQAATLTATGEVLDTPERQRLDALAAEMVNPGASRLDRIYEGRLRLIAYQLDPPSPHPGQTVKLTFYWQRVKEVEGPVRLTVQLADSRSLPLGRIDTGLSPHNGWLLGQVMPTVHEFELAADLTAPLAAQVEVALQNEAEVLLRPTTAAGEPLEASIARFTIAPERWPEPVEARPVEGSWQNGLALQGYRLLPEAARPGENLTVSLFWQANQAVAENYVVFVHLLDEAGQIKAQNDDLPRAGAYPTPWWQPGLVVEDTHTLVLPPDLPGGTYQLVTGLYRPEDGVRLPLNDNQDSLMIGRVEVP
jgi:hypothetical protein